jgi:hypothetical protein
MTTTLYRPRVHVQLTLPADEKVTRGASGGGESISFPVRVSRIWIERNDHNRADECKLQAAWKDAGCDPRLIRNAVVEVYVGAAAEDGLWRPERRDLRFAGIAKRVQRVAAEDEGFSVEFDFLDYTTLFLEAKPFATAGIPDVSMTLEQAWRTIVSQTPGADVLADRLAFEGGARGDLPLGKSVAPRFRRLAARVPTKPNTDAWAVWQHCVGMLGLISFIRADECVVTTATDLYTAERPPKFVWGRSILSMREARNLVDAGKGIGLTSYDPISGTAIEAVWPPVGDKNIKHKRLSAKKAQDQVAVRESEERIYYAYPGITNEEDLLEAAERVYEEKSRQELEGTMTTGEMFVEDVANRWFDVLSLSAGDVVRIEFEQRDRELLASLPTEQARVQYLVDRGYSRDLARFMARNMSELTRLEPNFFAKRVTTEFVEEEDGGSFTVEISYANRIQIDGDAL